MASSKVDVSSEWIVGPKQTPFFTSTFTVAEPSVYVLFIHGFNEHIGRYDAWFKDLASCLNAHVFAFDQRGFGRTAGSTPPPTVVSSDVSPSRVGVTNNGLQKDDIIFFLRREAARSKGAKVWVFGQSMGGALSLMTAAHSSKTGDLASLAGVVASSPLIHQTHPLGTIEAKALGAMTWLSPDKMVPVKIRVEELSRDPAVGRALLDDDLCHDQASSNAVATMLNAGKALLTDKAAEAWPAGLPVLIGHGDADQICDYEAVQKFISRLPAAITKQLHTSPGAFHELQNETADARAAWLEAIVSFVQAA